MLEADFWLALEFRICREFAGIPDGRMRNRWCDGVIPEQYHLDDAAPRIMGRAWICDGQIQENWAFSLFLPLAVGSRAEIDWASLLPPENRTRWLALDLARKYIELSPSAAVPDLA